VIANSVVDFDDSDLVGLGNEWYGFTTGEVYMEVELESMKLIASLNKGKASICTCIIGEKSKLAGMALKDIAMPKSLI
jgi:hypothetical protein